MLVHSNPGREHFDRSWEMTLAPSRNANETSQAQQRSPCTEYPGDRFYCTGGRFGVDDAMREVERAEAFRSDAILAAIHSSPAGGLAPDGLQTGDGQWDFFFVGPDSAIY